MGVIFGKNSPDPNCDKALFHPLLGKSVEGKLYAHEPRTKNTPKTAEDDDFSSLIFFLFFEGHQFSGVHGTRINSPFKDTFSWRCDPQKSQKVSGT